MIPPGYLIILVLVLDIVLTILTRNKAVALTTIMGVVFLGLFYVIPAPTSVLPRRDAIEERLSGVKTEPTPQQKKKATLLAIIGLAVSTLAMVGAFGALIVGILALVF